MSEWKKVKIGDVCTVTKGITGIKKAIAGKYPMVTLAADRTTHNEYQFDCAAVMIPLVSSTGHGHASMKRVHFQEGKFALGSILCAVVPNDRTILSPKYLHIYLSYLKDKLLVPLMHGAANVSLSVSNIKNVEIVLPPIEKQMEIIKLEDKARGAKIDLTNKFDFQKSHLEKLRQQILQDAISGKLTEDWRKENPNVEPASELLKQINLEKEKLIKEKKIKKEKSSLPITEGTTPFNLPEGWQWVRLEKIIYESPRNGYSPKTVQLRTDVKTLKLGATSKGFFLPNEIKYVDERIPEDSFLWLQDGDILVQRGNALELVGISAIFEGGLKEFIYPDLMMKIRPVSPLTSIYIHNILLSPFIREYFRQNAAGAQKTMPKINQSTVSNALIPIAPLAEQKTIVSKVEMLMGYVDQLEGKIAQSSNDAGSLMKAFLAEAFKS